MNIEILLNLLRSDGSIIVNKTLARNIGLNNAIMFSELISKYKYFADKDQLQDGYFFNTVENMQVDTTLTDHQQRQSIKELVILKLIEYKTKGMPAKRYFKITDNEKMLKMYLSEPAQFLKKSRTSSKEIQELILKNLRTYLKKVKSNNTNSNNTNLNNNKNNNNINGDDLKNKNRHSINNYEINLNLINKELSNFNDNTTNYDKEVIKEILIYYLKRHEDVFSKQHPILKIKHWQRVINDLFINPVAAIAQDLSYDEFEAMIDNYFKTDFQTHDVDYNILHFATMGIQDNRFFDAGLYSGSTV